MGKLGKLYLFMMVSTDGYFEGDNHDISWHNADNDEFNAFAAEQTGAAEILLFGHRTYDLMAKFWPTPEAIKMDPVVSSIMNDKPKIVVSHHEFIPDWGPTHVISTKVHKELTQIKKAIHGDIALLGSNNLCVNLLEAGLVDELRLMVNPVAIGKGRPFFSGIKKPQKLKLLSSRVFLSGNMLLTYAPIK